MKERGRLSCWGNCCAILTKGQDGQDQSNCCSTINIYIQTHTHTHTHTHMYLSLSLCLFHNLFCIHSNFKAKLIRIQSLSLAIYIYMYVYDLCSQSHRHIPAPRPFCTFICPYNYQQHTHLYYILSSQDIFLSMIFILPSRITFILF